MEDGKWKPVDIVCAHLKDGSTVPLRIRVRDEDGVSQAFAVKEYRDLSGQGTKTMPDGVYVTDNTLVFECRINVFGRSRTIRLYHEPGGKVWRMTA